MKKDTRKKTISGASYFYTQMSREEQKKVMSEAVRYANEKQRELFNKQPKQR